jgi:hypothetical protein
LMAGVEVSTPGVMRARARRADGDNTMPKKGSSYPGSHAGQVPRRDCDGYIGSADSQDRITT